MPLLTGYTLLLSALCPLLANSILLDVTSSGMCTTLPDGYKLAYSCYFSLHQECLKRRGQRHAPLLPRSGPWQYSWPLWIIILLILLLGSWRRLGEPDRLLELHGRYSIRQSRTTGFALASGTRQGLRDPQSDQNRGSCPLSSGDFGQKIDRKGTYRQTMIKPSGP